MVARFSLVLTCEHGGNEVPQAYRNLFEPHSDLLNSHRGYDPGAAELAEYFASHLHRPLVMARTTRLLVELNRSQGNRNHFSIVTRDLSPERRREIITHYYHPYREEVDRILRREITSKGRVLHLSVHSFTPILDGKVRNADVGLLYDPSRPGERTFAREWKRAIQNLSPDLKVRFNYPYLGTADGFTTYLRSHHPDDCYAGIELEVNQRFPLGEGKSWTALQETLSRSLEQVIQALGQELNT